LGDVLDTLWEGISNALLMAWTVWWALVLGLAISAIVQAWVPRERVQNALGGSGARPIALATALGAASSSCSYAAIAIARSLFQKGASAASTLAFQFASTNLVVELGIVIWVLIGWQFTLAELIGGIALIAIMSTLVRMFISPRIEDEARAHAQVAADAGHHHHDHDGSEQPVPLRARLGSLQQWSRVASSFRHDCSMLWKELAAGFLIAGFIGLLGNDFFNALFLRHAPAALRLLENVTVGPLIAAASFVCSVGNVPIAAVLWSGGIGFGGVIAFIFADLIVLPIVLLYRKYYGRAFALRITLLMLVTTILAALLVDLLFAGAGLIPSARPNRGELFGHIEVGYELVLNAFALLVLLTLLGLSRRADAGASACPAHTSSRNSIEAQTGRKPSRA